MSSHENPYRAPQGEQAFAPATQAVAGAPPLRSGDNTLYRKGKLLVMHKNAALPAKCIKSNVDANRRLKRDLQWHHPALFLFVPVGLLIYVIIAMTMRKTATIHVGLSDEWFARRRKAMIVAWLLIPTSFVLFIGSLIMSEDYPPLAWGAALAAVMFFGGLIYGIVGTQIVTPTRMSNTHIWLKGVSPEYLAGLPEWPHRP